MPSIKLINAAENLLHAPGVIDVDPSGEFTVELEHLTAGKSAGVTLVTLGNGACRVSVIPTRGMGVWQGEVDDWRIGWNAPVRGPVHPAFVQLMEPGGIGWLDGFDELLVRCGLTSNGAPVFDDRGVLQLPLHGRIANTPAHFAELEYDAEAGRLTVTGHVEETRLFHGKLRLTSQISLERGKPGFLVKDTVTNLSAEPGEMQLLYHINLGTPLLQPGGEVAVPFQQMAPRDTRAAEGIERWNQITDGESGFAEQVYFFQPAADDDGRATALLRNADASRGVSVTFNPAQLPCFAVWKSLQHEADGYVTGLEPATNFPNPKPFEQRHGRVVALPPGGSAVFDLAIGFHNSSAEIKRIEETTARTQSRHAGSVNPKPKAEWTG